MCIAGYFLNVSFKNVDSEVQIGSEGVIFYKFMVRCQEKSVVLRTTRLCCWTCKVFNTVNVMPQNAQPRSWDATG